MKLRRVLAVMEVIKGDECQDTDDGIRQLLSKRISESHRLGWCRWKRCRGCFVAELFGC